ncbi:hypothetical protein MPER_12262 [Moniliophthora perniciosa FA553]|nr:hypothetical protein MPER_12262 [Moniliophthora perniciosa FA553]
MVSEQPKLKTNLSDSIVRRILQDKTIDEYANKLDLEDIVHEVFGVEEKVEILPRWTLIACLRRSSQSTAVPAAPTQDDNEATDIVGKMQRGALVNPAFLSGANGIVDFERYTAGVASGSTPSAAAKSTNYSENQNTEKTKTALLDGRVKELGQTTAALPIELYHPAFAKFRSNAQNLNFEVPDEILRKTAELIRKLSTIRAYEDSRTTDCKALLSRILGTSLDEVTNADKTAADFTSPLPTELGASAVPDMAEIKSEWGSGGCDPSVQVSFSYARFYCQEEVSLLSLSFILLADVVIQRKTMLSLSCCPSFLIGLAGSWIGILGAVMTTRTIVQRLSGFEWFGASRVLDTQHVLKLGRLLYALRLGIAELKEYYSKLEAPTVIPGTDSDSDSDSDSDPGSDSGSETETETETKAKVKVKPKPKTVTPVPPRFCPYVNSFVDSEGQTIHFSYVTPLEHDPVCATFKAKLLDGQDAGKLVVVKFVESYGVDAHRHLAKKGFAPQLLHDGTSGPHYGDLSLIVMDFVEGQTLHDLYQGAIPKDVRKAIRKVLDELAKKQFIIGDLRRPNVMLVEAEDADESVEKRLRFIDFDWACREGDGMRYPFHLASVVREPSGAREYDIIERKHQESMFEKLDSK